MSISTLLDRRLVETVRDNAISTNVTQDFSKFKEYATVEEYRKDFNKILNLAIKDGWVLVQEVKIFWNNGKTKYIAIVGRM